jgi:NTP pyrophosphatase (non-canonical NTP hydrolase)
MNNKYPVTLNILLDLANTSVSNIQNGFDDYQNQCFTERSPEFFCLELNGECGELANLEKKVWKGKNIEHVKFEDEAADVFIALMNYCNARKINLQKAVSDKLVRIENLRAEMKAEGEDY